MVKWLYSINHGPENGTTTHLFDASGNLLRSSTTTELCAFAGFNTGCRDTKTEVVFSYENGRLASQVSSSSEGPQQSSTSFEYDTAGRLAKQTLTRAGMRPSVLTLRYDAKGDLAERHIDFDGNGISETDEVIRLKRDAGGRLVELGFEQLKPKVDLKRGNQAGTVKKTTTFSYDAQGHLTGAVVASKSIEIDFSKRRAPNAPYTRMLANKTQSTSYRTSSDGAIESMRTCRDPADHYSCSTTTLTLGGADTPEKRLVQSATESMSEELYGDCHFEQLPPTDNYVRAGGRYSVGSEPDNYAFEVRAGKRSRAAIAPAGSVAAASTSKSSPAPAAADVSTKPSAALLVSDGIKPCGDKMGLRVEPKARYEQYLPKTVDTWQLAEGTTIGCQNGTEVWAAYTEPQLRWTTKVVIKLGPGARLDPEILSEHHGLPTRVLDASMTSQYANAFVFVAVKQGDFQNHEMFNDKLEIGQLIRSYNAANP